MAVDFRDEVHRCEHVINEEIETMKNKLTTSIMALVGLILVYALGYSNTIYVLDPEDETDFTSIVNAYYWKEKDIHKQETGGKNKNPLDIITLDKLNQEKLMALKPTKIVYIGHGGGRDTDTYWNVVSSLGGKVATYQLKVREYNKDNPNNKIPYIDLIKLHVCESGKDVVEFVETGKLYNDGKKEKKLISYRMGATLKNTIQGTINMLSKEKDIPVPIVKSTPYRIQPGLTKNQSFTKLLMGKDKEKYDTIYSEMNKNWVIPELDVDVREKFRQDKTVNLDKVMNDESIKSSDGKSLKSKIEGASYENLYRKYANSKSDRVALITSLNKPFFRQNDLNSPLRKILSYAEYTKKCTEICEINGLMIQGDKLDTRWIEERRFNKKMVVKHGILQKSLSI